KYSKIFLLRVCIAEIKAGIRSELSSMKIDEIERMKARLSTIAASEENCHDKGARSDVVLVLFLTELSAGLSKEMQAHVQEILRLHEQCWSPLQRLWLPSRRSSEDVS